MQGIGSTARRPPAAAFTLTEIVIAVGIFSFAIIGVVFLLGEGLRSAALTRTDAAVAAALFSVSAEVRSSALTGGNQTLFFDPSGSPTSVPGDAYLRVEVQSVGSGGLADPVDIWTARVTGPLPSTNLIGRFLISRHMP